MRRLTWRTLTTAVVALALAAVTGGVAEAAETPVWLLPGADVGVLLGPTVQLPTALLEPVAGLLNSLG